MPRARKTLISLTDTAYYHCVSRCVRRAYLCGQDKVSGKSYEHRRQWVEDRLHILAEVFAIKLCAYAVMSNHTHVVLHVNQDSAYQWSDMEVIRRWHRLHKGTLLSQMFVNESARAHLSAAERLTLEETVKVWRQRLWDVSWFMRCLNEPIARMANQEDDCTGRFWEGRFKSQALLDEAALIACMAYVDLNPVRAGMATKPETSPHTSVNRRMKTGKASKALLPFYCSAKDKVNAIPFSYIDYLKLLRSTGQCLGKSLGEHIDTRSQPILKKLAISNQQWLQLATEFESCFQHIAGAESCLLAYQDRHKLKKLKGISTARRLLSP